MRTMDSEPPVLSWVPVFLFSTGTGNNDVTSVLRKEWSQISHRAEKKKIGRTFGSVSISNQPLQRWHLHRKENMGVEKYIPIFFFSAL